MPKNICNDGVVQRQLMDLPGFRFHPTEEELVGFYLKNRIQAARYPLNFDKIIPTIDLYQYEPWDLPGLAHDVGEQQWFFFVPRYYKKCARPNRLTLSGYWKATGSDRKIRNGLLHCIGLKKILVFYKGKAPRGQKTDWIMNEYRMLDLSSSTLEKKIDMVLCKIYQKAITQKSMEQGANHIADVDKEEVVASTDELYEEKSHSKSRNVISCQSNPMSTEANVSSLQDEKGVCSSLCKTMDESNLFDCLEPIMPWEESMVLKTTTTCKPPHLELPNLSMDFLFSQPIETPYALLSTPSPFQIPF